MLPLSIIKIGGNLLDDELKLQQAIVDFARISTPKILVHGGGKRASEMCRQLGIEPRMINGRRITDQATLEVATMVYAGMINKQLVSYLQRQHCNAIGFSGADGNLITAVKRDSSTVDYGFAGDVKTINTELLRQLLTQKIAPVFCAITHDGNGQLLNTNADTIAAVLATALSPHFQVSLKFCFEKEGVLADPRDEASVLPVLSTKMYQRHQHKGTISNGMIPKLDNAFAAKKSGAHRVVICGAEGILHQKGTEICL